MPVHPILETEFRIDFNWTADKAAKLAELAKRRGTPAFLPSEEQLYQRLALIQAASRPVRLMDEMHPTELMLAC